MLFIKAKSLTEERYLIDIIFFCQAIEKGMSLGRDKCILIFFFYYNVSGSEADTYNISNTCSIVNIIFLFQRLILLHPSTAVLFSPYLLQI